MTGPVMPTSVTSASISTGPCVERDDRSRLDKRFHDLPCRLGCPFLELARVCAQSDIDPAAAHDCVSAALGGLISRAQYTLVVSSVKYTCRLHRLASSTTLVTMCVQSGTVAVDRLAFGVIGDEARTRLPVSSRSLGIK